MNDYLSQFETWLRNEDKGTNTIKTYLSVMAKFTKWYEGTTGQKFQPQDVTTVQIQDYRSYMQTVENAKPATINKALATLKTFFSWSVDAGHIISNPSLKVKMKRVQTTHAPKWLNDSEQNRIRHALFSEKNEFKRARDTALVGTMLDGGLRIDEVTSLRLRDVDLKGETITVINGKGGKYRSVPMTKDLRRTLKTWITLRGGSNKAIHQDSEFLFVSERAGRMTTRAIEYVVDVYLERCGLLERSSDGAKSEGYSCHSLRHTFCKRLVNAGWPIQNVARVAGHDSIQTTMRYVEPSEDELKRAIQNI